MKIIINMKTIYIRYSRILKHLALYVFTFSAENHYEIMHYFYMKKFSDINNYKK